MLPMASPLSVFGGDSSQHGAARARIADAFTKTLEGFEAMMAGGKRVLAGSLKSKAQGKASRLMPDSAKAEMHRKMAEPGSVKQ